MKKTTKTLLKLIFLLVKAKTKDTVINTKKLLDWKKKSYKANGKNENKYTEVGGLGLLESSRKQELVKKSGNTSDQALVAEYNERISARLPNKL